MYQRRNKMDPFYNTLVVAGYKHNKPLEIQIIINSLKYEANL